MLTDPEHPDSALIPGITEDVSRGITRCMYTQVAGKGGKLGVLTPGIVDEHDGKIMFLFGSKFKLNICNG